MSMKFLTIALTTAALVLGPAASAFAKGGHGGHGGHGHGHGHYGHFYKSWGYSSYSDGCYWVHKRWGRVKVCPSYY